MSSFSPHPWLWQGEVSQLTDAFPGKPYTESLCTTKDVIHLLNLGVPCVLLEGLASVSFCLPEDVYNDEIIVLFIKKTCLTLNCHTDF